MANRYKFIRVVAQGNDVFARFEVGMSGIFGMLGKSRHVYEREKVCKELYKEACANENHGRGGYTSSSSKEDARKAFHAIREYKKKHGIPLDVKDLDA